MAGESAGAAAPSGGQSGASSNTGGAQQQGGVSTDAGGGLGGPGDGFDYQRAFQSQQRELQQAKGGFQALKGEIDSYRQKTEPELDMLRKMREVFAPQAPAEENPVEQWEQEMDYYIAQGIEAEKAGHKMPLTINLAINHYKDKIRNYNESKHSKQVIAQLQAQVQALSDPQVHINQRAYETLDATVARGLEQLYGAGEETLPEKRAIFAAVGQQLAPYIDNLRKTKPEVWNDLRRKPEELAAIAQKFLRRHIPPRAQQILAQEQLENTPMPISEMKQAFREAQQIQDPVERDRITTLIRRDILQATWEASQGRR